MRSFGKGRGFVAQFEMAGEARGLIYGGRVLSRYQVAVVRGITGQPT